MFCGYQHLLNFDFKHARKETRQYACTFDSKVVGKKWLRPENYPEEYGFNAILLDDKVNLHSSKFKVSVKGEHLRYGFVGVTTDDEEIYSDVNAGTFIVPKDKRLAHLYLLVMGAPEQHYQIPMPTEENPEPPKAELQQCPYTFRITDK
jgi:hypothetical protein